MSEGMDEAGVMKGVRQLPAIWAYREAVAKQSQSSSDASPLLTAVGNLLLHFATLFSFRSIKC